MKVMIVSQFPVLGTEPIGGVECAVVALCQGLGVSPEVTDLRVVSLSPVVRAREEKLWGGEVSVTYLPYSGRLSAFNRFAEARALVSSEVDAFRPDVVHGQGLDAHGYAAVWSNAPVRVVTPHGDMWQDDFFNSGNPVRWSRGLVRSLLGRSTLSRADGLVAISPHSARGRRGVTVAHIPNAVRREFCSPMTPSSGAVAILVPSAVKRVKGIERVFLAAASVAREAGVLLPISVAGPPSDAAYHAELKSLAQGLPEIAVEWLGAKGTSAMVGAMDHSSVIALGSSHEVSPVCIGEALMRGRSVVAPDLQGVRALTGDGVFGALYQPRSVEGLAHALRASMAEAAGSTERRRYAEGRFTPVCVASLTLALYGRLVSAWGQS